MGVYSVVPDLEDIGLDVPEFSILKGNVFDIEGNPLEVDIFVSLNALVSQYKTQFGLANEPPTVTSSPIDGSWTVELPDTSNMRADSYYRITINERTFRKVLPDFPRESFLNDLQDY